MISILLLLSMLNSSAYAIDAFEIQVYDAEINGVGQYTLENHINTAFKAKQVPDFSGQISFDKLTHWTLEFARGMTEWWELGAYLQTAYSSNLTPYYGGVKLRTKFVIPRDKSLDHNFQTGINFELGNVPAYFEPAQFVLEIRPILGYSLSNITLLFNPILDFVLSNTPSPIPVLAPAFKTYFATPQNFAMGLEYYSDFGRVDQIQTTPNQEHYLFAALDLLNRSYELNFAVGSGLTPASNGLMVKTIVGFHL